MEILLVELRSPFCAGGAKTAVFLKNEDLSNVKILNAVAERDGEFIQYLEQILYEYKEIIYLLRKTQ